jgi:energy-coupling factor transporter ATP-binding protein EcfA2
MTSWTPKNLMARPSLTPTPSGLAVARQALSQKGLTQVELVRELHCSRQPISNFFGGRAIEQRLFIAICNRVGLDWQEIAGMKTIASPVVEVIQSKNTQSLIRRQREQVQAEITRRCGPIRILGLNTPIDPEEIYTEVKVLEKIPAYRWQTIDDSMAETKIDDRWSLGKVNLDRIPGIKALEEYKLLILSGKPGAGKTTFLQHLATKCNQGELAVDRVPVFLSLKDWNPDLSLLEYIEHSYGTRSTIAIWQQIFQAGQGLLLLDGLDEIPKAQEERILGRMREFVGEFTENYIVISCRVAVWEGVHGFERFTEVELADFDDEQIAKFIYKWFKDKPQGQELAAKFLNELTRNPELKDLVVTPILLPLVCLAFEDQGTCPHTRTRLYQVGIEILLTKWDDRRGIDRYPVYRWLSPELKMKLLARIALKTLQERQYFFTGAVVEEYILDFLKQHTQIEPQEIDARSILKAIVAQHGLLVERSRDIYSFSHLTFHEYFAARDLIPTPTHHPSTESLAVLMDHLDDGSTWREVWLLAVELLSHGSRLLQPLQDDIHQLVSDNPEMAAYLRQLPHIAPELDTMSQPLLSAACLALRFDIDFDLDHNRSVAFALDQRSSIFVAASFAHRMLGTNLQQAITQAEADPQIAAAKTANEAMRLVIENVLKDQGLATENQRKLEELKQRYEQAGSLTNDEEVLDQMATDARTLARDRVRLGDLGHRTEDFRKSLKQYYNRIGIIVECLQNRDCQVSLAERKQLKEFLFKAKDAGDLEINGAKLTF